MTVAWPGIVALEIVHHLEVIDLYGEIEGDVKLESQISGQHNKVHCCALHQAKKLAERQDRSFSVCCIQKEVLNMMSDILVSSSGESFALETRI